jgi:hypothetical protein
VPFRFDDVGSPAAQRLLAGQGIGTSRLPVMISHDGYAMVQPGQAQLIAVVGGSVASDARLVRVADGSEVTAKTVIVAPGITWRRLGVSRLEQLVGSGVFYGAAGTEAQAMEGRDVCVVGAGNSAGQATLHLARYARQVTMLVRGDDLASSMSDYLITEIAATPNIAVRTGTEIAGGRSRPRCQGSSPPATPGTAPSSESPRPSAMAPQPCDWPTSTWACRTL